MQNDGLLLQPYLKTLTLLCVDSSPIIRSIYEGLFSILFKEVILAENAEDALALYKDKKIDLMISAQDFSGMSGIEMIKILRKRRDKLPIIFVSSFEQSSLLREAMALKIHYLVEMPFETTDLLEAIENASRQLLADKYLEDEKEKELSSLKNKIDYSDYQETLSFQKALRIIKNDFYYKNITHNKNSFILIDFLYKAKDVISGDSYSARKLDDNRILLFLIDGMGKGVSASISAMMSVTFLNRIIDKQLKKDRFSLKKILTKMIQDTQKILLEDEIISASFVIFDTRKTFIEYASFSMPSILLQNKDNDIISLKSNNPPINAYKNSIKIDKCPCQDIKKMLVYSDGLVENSLKNEKNSYEKYIKEDFKNSVSREDFRKKIAQKIDKQEDDISFIFVNHITYDDHLQEKIINTKIEEIEQLHEWFENQISIITHDETTQCELALAFSELLMNAYEHGNLGIDTKQKHRLIATNEYFDYLLQNESICDKKIHVNLYTFSNSDGKKYILIQIEDEGKGFDTSILKNIFGINKKFNHRGVLMSRNSSLGLYYNYKGNQVSFIAAI